MGSAITQFMGDNYQNSIQLAGSLNEFYYYAENESYDFLAITHNEEKVPEEMIDVIERMKSKGYKEYIANRCIVFQRDL